MTYFPSLFILDSNEPLHQGDFLTSGLIIIPTMDLSSMEIETKVLEYDVIIMSQSCDLIQKKVDLVLVCPVWSLQEIEQVNQFYKSTQWKNALRRGHIPGYHLLNRCTIEGFERDHAVVDFRNVYGVPFNFLINLAKQSGNRLSLISPYKEHLSQAFARFFMRVGLPIDILEFKKSNSKKSIFI